MEGKSPDYKFLLQSRVRLMSEVADVYTAAVGGSEGTIKAHRIESIGEYRMIYVEWDQDHWAYNGERNMWSFEDHFELVTLPKAKEPKPKESSRPNVLQQLMNVIQESKENRLAPNPVVMNYDAALREAVIGARGGSAFLMIVMKEVQSPEDDEIGEYIPSVSSFCTSEEVELILKAQLSNLGAMAHIETATDLVQELLIKRMNEE